MPHKEVIIDGKRIGEDTPIFLIAEAGVNHNGKVEIARKLIDIAVEAQVDAIKFQTFITEKLILKTTPKVEYQKNSSEDREDFFEMIKKYELTKKDFKNLKDYCSINDIIFLSTPFDEPSVNILEELGVSAFKVGSGDMNNQSLLKLICSKGKPILLSTGMATLDEVEMSIEFIKENGIDDIVIFQCTTNYPALHEELNLNVIDSFKEKFKDALIGFSDHSLGIEASVGAAVKGVSVIEKHFTLDKNMKGPDHKASLNPKELVEWVNAIRNIEKALGSSVKKPTKSEEQIAKIAKKSVVSTSKLDIGEVLTEENITVKRPGTGISAKDYYNIIGKKVKKRIPKDTIIHWEDLE